jgi:hypothetical protein
VTGEGAISIPEQEEAPLDYSLMDVHVENENPEVNGYSVLRLLAQRYEAEVDEFLEQVGRVELDRGHLESISKLIEEQEFILDAIAIAFERPEFYFDQQMTPQTYIPEVGLMRYYILASMFNVRRLMALRDDDAALEHLMDVEVRLKRFGQAGGGIIHLLTTLSCYGIWEAQVIEFLSETKTSPDSLIEAATEVDFYKSFSVFWQTAIRYEFHFSKYCIELTLEEPLWTKEILSKELGIDDSQSNQYVSELLLQSFKHTFDPGLTTNKLFTVYAESMGEANQFSCERSHPAWSQFSEYIAYPDDQALSVSNPVGRILLRLLVPAIDAVQQQVDLSSFSGSATEVFFGLRAYWGDTGALPDRLNELVPKYLKSIPRDPFDGQPLRYSKEAAIVYSVGNDFVDSGGSRLPFALSESPRIRCAERDLTEPTFLIRFK